MLTKERLLEVMTTVSARFADVLKARTQAPIEAIVTEDTCGSNGYSPFLLGSLGAGRKWVGSRVYARLKSYAVRFQPEKFEKTVEVEADELADNPAFNGAKVADRLMESWSLTDAKELQGILKNNKAGFDGEPLFGEHEYVDQNADGTIKLDAQGAPVVLGTYVNDIAGDQAAWYLASKNSLVRVTREEPSIVMKGGSADSSEHTFDEDTLVWGWKARKIYAPGLAFYTVRSRKALTEATYQEAEDLMATFINDSGELVDNKATHIVVKRGTPAATAAKRIFGRQLVDGGENNIYFGRVQIIEVDYI